jgi:hypothetical protein
MRSTAFRATVSLLPVAVPLAAWQLSPLVGLKLGCPAVGKSQAQCFVGSFEVMSSLSFAWWLGMLLWIPGLIVSGLWVGKIVAGQLRAPWGCRASPVKPPGKGSAS